MDFFFKFSSLVAQRKHVYVRWLSLTSKLLWNEKEHSTTRSGRWESGAVCGTSEIEKMFLAGRKAGLASTSTENTGKYVPRIPLEQRMLIISLKSPSLSGKVYLKHCTSFRSSCLPEKGIASAILLRTILSVTWVRFECIWKESCLLKINTTFLWHDCLTTDLKMQVLPQILSFASYSSAKVVFHENAWNFFRTTHSREGATHGSHALRALLREEKWSQFCQDRSNWIYEREWTNTGVFQAEVPFSMLTLISASSISSSTDVSTSPWICPWSQDWSWTQLFFFCALVIPVGFWLIPELMAFLLQKKKIKYTSTLFLWAFSLPEKAQKHEDYTIFCCFPVSIFLSEQPRWRFCSGGVLRRWHWRVTNQLHRMVVRKQRL